MPCSAGTVAATPAHAAADQAEPAKVSGMITHRCDNYLSPRAELSYSSMSLCQKTTPGLHAVQIPHAPTPPPLGWPTSVPFPGGPRGQETNRSRGNQATTADASTYRIAGLREFRASPPPFGRRFQANGNLPGSGKPTWASSRAASRENSNRIPWVFTNGRNRRAIRMPTEAQITIHARSIQRCLDQLRRGPTPGWHARRFV